MKLIALLIGLAVERLATQLFHLRELHWLDRLIDSGLARVERMAGWPPLVLVVGIIVAMVLPVFLVRLSLGDALLGFPYLLFAVVVLFFSFGPEDIAEEVDEYCAALSDEDDAALRAASSALLEREPPEDPEACRQAVEEAVFVQGNNRLFAVVFWFVVLGPLGAWAYRATDLVRRRAAFRSPREPHDGVPDSGIARAAEDLHGWLALVPARLAAAGYALAGSFEGALSAWRTRARPGLRVHEQNEWLLARVGVAALALQPVDGEGTVERGTRGASAAKGVVLRALFIWAAVIAAMTLYGWSV